MYNAPANLRINALSNESKTYDAALSDARLARIVQALPGFEVTEALARLSNNVACYRELLADLCKSLDETLTALKPLILGGGIKEALIHLHGLKGMSGNLGATSLCQVFQKLERALSTSQEEEYEILITRMEQTIHRNLAVINAFIQTETAAISDPPGPDIATKELVIETISLLARRLEEGRLDAVDVFKRLKHLLHHRHSHPEFKKLAAAIECLDYANARKSLAAVAVSINMAL